MTDPGDFLAQQVRAYVATFTPPDQVEAVCRGVAYALIRVTSDPNLASQLRIVQELQQENVWLRNQLAIAQGALARYTPAKKATARKRPAKKAPTKAQQAAFKRGVRDIRG